MPDLLQFVPWRHQTVIVSKCDTINAAMFYLNKVIEGNMSRTELEHVIKAQLYEHTSKALNNFDVTLPQPQNALILGTKSLASRTLHHLIAKGRLQKTMWSQIAP